MNPEGQDSCHVDGPPRVIAHPNIKVWLPTQKLHNRGKNLRALYSQLRASRSQFGTTTQRFAALLQAPLKSPQQIVSA
jgi:hypothetical protein